MPYLPTEILHCISHLAAYVPEAFDTSFDAVQEEDREHVLQLIQESLLVKLSLSLVSRQFHSIVESFLYENVLILQFQYIPILLDRLRSVPHGHNRPLGHTCRRLEIYLGMGSDSPYQVEAWNEGGHILWGLPIACPHIEVFIARIAHQGVLDEWEDTFCSPLLTSNALWKTLSSLHARSLRRLELFGLSIRMDRVEMMLRYMLALEVCDISDCKPFWDLDLFDLQTETEGNWQPDTYDDEEAIFGYVIGGETIEIVGPMNAEEATPSAHFDDTIRSELEDAILNATWPTFDGSSAPYILPRLHSLTLNTFNYRFFEFSLPSVRSLATHDVQNARSLFKIYTKATFFPEPSISNPYVYDSANGNGPPPELRYKPKLFPTPERHSTLFGTFPPTLTHLSIKCVASLGQILYFFPNITHLVWNVPQPERLPFTVPHTALRRIVICDNRSSNRFERLLNTVAEVIRAVRQGWLLELQEIVCRFGMDERMLLVPLVMINGWEEGLPYKDCKELGLTLSVEEMKTSNLVCRCGY
ncbi:hypothetical protein H0H92_003670 [Tricholoma furcatifolium]|nr:hypothetical protein H0H92_003670 [Tricholoma furcatifolium]